MHALSCLLLMAVAAGGGGAPAHPAWERVFDGGDAQGVSLIEATGRDDWVAGGPWGLATARAGQVSVESTHGHGVLGLFTDSPLDVYALGEGELIWHFDGTNWNEEHVGPLPSGRRAFAQHMLYLAYRQPSDPVGPLIAIGLEQALVRRPAQAAGWTAPPRAQQDLLRDVGLRGPELALPSRCARAGWHWLGDRSGAFYCHDRRAFIWDAGTITPKGTMPGACFDGLNALIAVKGTLYAACDAATLWKVEGQAWRRIAPPPRRESREQAPGELLSLSHAAGCLFAADGRAVWRRCGE